MRKTIPLALCALAIMVLPTVMQASDRDADMIDSATAEFGFYEEVDTVGFSILGETAIASVPKQWTILAGIGYQSISGDSGGQLDVFYGDLGVKHYCTDLLSAWVVGRYTELDLPGEPDQHRIAIGSKLRFADAEEAVSPFALCELLFDQGDRISGTRHGYRAGGGVEFQMKPAWSLGLEFTYNDAEGSAFDGFLSLISMKYYMIDL